MRGILVLAVLVAATPAMADDGDIPLFHKGQIGFSARFGIGVRGIATYNSDYCGVLDATAKNGNAPVCTGRSPLAMDFEASYGVARSVELTLELQVGLERDFGTTPATDGPRPLHIAPGARFFFGETRHTKLFVQPEIVFDYAAYPQGHDFGVRGLEGYWVDLHHAYGLYFFVSETAEFSRWLYAEFEAGFGFQGRYP